MNKRHLFFLSTIVLTIFSAAFLLSDHDYISEQTKTQADADRPLLAAR